MEQEQKQEQEHGIFILELPKGQRVRLEERRPKMESRQFKSTTHEERFLHVKDLPVESKYSVATVFARKEVNAAITPNGVVDGWFASVAFCWKTDQFSREQGRQNARRIYFRPNAKVKPFYLGADFNYEIAEALVAKVLKEMFDH